MLPSIGFKIIPPYRAVFKPYIIRRSAILHSLGWADSVLFSELQPLLGPLQSLRFWHRQNAENPLIEQSRVCFTNTNNFFNLYSRAIFNTGKNLIQYLKFLFYFQPPRRVFWQKTCCGHAALLQYIIKTQRIHQKIKKTVFFFSLQLSHLGNRAPLLELQQKKLKNKSQFIIIGANATLRLLNTKITALSSVQLTIRQPNPKCARKSKKPCRIFALIRFGQGQRSREQKI